MRRSRGLHHPQMAIDPMKWIFNAAWLMMLSVCVFIFAGSAIKPFGRVFLDDLAPDGYKAGDLYSMAKADYFKEVFKEITVQQQSTLEEAEIIAFGDSFFNTAQGDAYIADLLRERTGRSVFTVDNRGETTPLEYLDAAGYRKGEEKIFLYQIAEHNSLHNAGKNSRQEKSSRHEDVYVPSGWLDRLYNSIRWRRSAANAWLRAANAWLKEYFIVMHNNNEDFQYFLVNNKFFSPLARWIANVRFDLLEELDPRIGAFSKQPRILFYDRVVEFNVMPLVKQGFFCVDRALC